jgi:hypothetical protein
MKLSSHSHRNFTSAITQFNLFKRWSSTNYLHPGIAYLEWGDRYSLVNSGLAVIAVEECGERFQAGGYAGSIFLTLDI